MHAHPDPDHDPHADERTDRLIEFIRRYYNDPLGRLAQRYPSEQRALHVSHGDLATFDADLAEEWLTDPETVQAYADEALQLVDLPAAVSLDQPDAPPAEVREVFVSPVREVQGDHPDEVGDHLGPERQFGPDRGQRAEPDREQEQRRARRADCRPFRFSEKPPHRTRRRRSHGRSYGRYGVRASSPLFGIL